jgi:hypothetical protein
VHTVTKVLVVFAAILSVLLAALTMAYAVNVERIISDRAAESNRRVTADATASAAIAQAKELQAQLNDQKQQLEAQISKLNSDIASLQGERTQLINDKTQAINSRDAVIGETEQAIATSKTQALLIQQYRDEVTKLRENELGYKRREIELTDRLNDLQSQLEVSQQSTRALQEQLVEANRQIQSGGGANQRVGSAAPGPYTPNFAVSAKVVSTSKDRATGKPMATIDVGSNNQIRENMELAVVRNGEFLANFIVTKADLGWAQGWVDYHGKKVEIQPGDRVVSVLASR